MSSGKKLRIVTVCKVSAGLKRNIECVTAPVIESGHKRYKDSFSIHTSVVDAPEIDENLQSDQVLGLYSHFRALVGNACETAETLEPLVLDFASGKVQLIQSLGNHSATSLDAVGGTRSCSPSAETQQNFRTVSPAVSPREGGIMGTGLSPIILDFESRAIRYSEALPFSNEQSDSFPSPATQFPAVSEHHSAGVQSRTGDAHSVPLSNTFTRIDVPVNETRFRLNATANGIGLPLREGLLFFTVAAFRCVNILKRLKQFETLQELLNK